MVDALEIAADEVVDFPRSIGTALGQLTHLFGNDGKPAAMLACSGCLDRGVQGQDVGLEGD